MTKNAKQKVQQSARRVLRRNFFMEAVRREERQQRVQATKNTT